MSNQGQCPTASLGHELFHVFQSLHLPYPLPVAYPGETGANKTEGEAMRVGNLVRAEFAGYDAQTGYYGITGGVGYNATNPLPNPYGSNPDGTPSAKPPMVIQNVAQPLPSD
jgi:hypothetical protein